MLDERQEKLPPAPGLKGAGGIPAHGDRRSTRAARRRLEYGNADDR